MPLFVGAISGTSIDGLDLALVEIDGVHLELVNSSTVEFPLPLKERLIRLASTRGNIVDVGRTSSALGSFTGNAIVQFLQESGTEPGSVRAIGSHGQTVHHFPNTDEAFSMQIGEAARIAETTGIDTIADFRSRDIAAGGQGAPLVPLFHARLFQSTKFDRVVLNIGGIANVTYLPKNASAVHKGFDTGPGNALIDAFVLKSLNQQYDENGAIAASGDVNAHVLEQLLADQWLQRPPPKSTGKEHFNLEYVRQALRKSNQSPSNTDIVATLSEFTARTITDAILKWCCKSGEVIVCGGGRLNSYVMRSLQKNLSNCTVHSSDSLGVDGDFVEATTFAYLAHLFINRIAGNDPRVTGAEGERLLGCLYPA
ncbi:MAG: anhydro-N-acetylmuramic acid kinase [Gammaproteobacteria bacterium]|nr:anhydro-N-acetylmuramic acid kinase [Gammaproteobacteria bacterium]